MTETTIPVSEAIDEAVDFARGAWREAWAPMAVTGFGWLLIVVGGHAQVTPEVADIATKLGWGLQVFNLPLLGALYRLGVGGQAYRGLGPGGLQLGGVEGRVAAVNAVLAFFCLLTCLPMIVLSGVFFLVLHRIGGVTLGPAGPWAWWFLLSVVFWAGLLAWLVYMCGRLSMATPLSVERRRILPFTGWPLTEGYGRVIATAFTLAQAPTLIVVLALAAFGWIEPADVPVGLHGPWPLAEAIGAGAVVGMVLSGLQAPLSVGLLTFFYDVLAPAEDDRVPAAPIDEAPPAPPVAEEEPPHEPEPYPEPEFEAESEPLLETDHPFSRVEYVPHTGLFSRLFAPWLSHEQVPEPYAHRVEAEPKPLAHDEPPTPEPPHEPSPEPEVYPRSIIEYSPRTGRFSRLFSPWLAADADPSAKDAEAPAPDVEPPHPSELDGADEAEHAEP